MTPVRHGLSLFALWLLACSEAPPPTEVKAHTPGTQQEASRSPQVPVEAVQPASPPPQPATARLGPLPKPPARGCVLVEDNELRTGRARALLSLHAGQLAALVLADDNRALEWWSGADGNLARTSTLPVDAAIQRAAVLSHAKAAFAAWIDERARLWLTEVKQGHFGAPRVLAQGVDRRFAPSLAYAGSLLVAHTRAVDEVMHTQLARVRGDSVSNEDLTPDSHGAAAACFVLGAAPPSLIMIDARAGVSPLLEVRFDAQGKASPASVRTPVSQPYAPPALAAVALSEQEVEVAFTAIGRAAATAIGRVPLYRAQAPEALVPSRGYGELQFCAARGTRAALFALDAFTAPSKDAPRALSVKLVDTQGEGGILVVRAEDPQGHAPSLAAGARAGEFWLTYTLDAAVRLARLACDA